MTSSQSAFICIEGADGTGKSTLVRSLTNFFNYYGHPSVAFRDPGSTQLGEHLRPFLKDPERDRLDPFAEVLLFNAMKLQLVSECVLPAMEEGKLVFCDRFALSTFVYQGYLPGVNMRNFISLMSNTSPAAPTCYIVLQAELHELQRRRVVRGGPPDNYENDATLPRLVEGFRYPEMWTQQPLIEIDTTSLAPMEVLFRAVTGLRDLLPSLFGPGIKALTLDDLLRHADHFTLPAP